MPPASSSTSRKPKSLAYRCFSSLFTKRAQIIAFVALLFLTFFMIPGLYTALTYYSHTMDDKFIQEYNIQSAMNSSLMIDCDYVVTPWFLNLCLNEDTANAYAWRHYKLLNKDNPNCVDIYERTQCYDKNVLLKPNRTRIFPNACPISSMLFEEENFKVSWMKDMANLTESAVVVKMPLISNLQPYLNQNIRAMDLFMMCPSCAFRGCDNENSRPMFHKFRHGWPFSFAECKITGNATSNLIYETMNDEKFVEV
uniref:Uncharacterized protein n=1 Tax=Panagrolaimus sp. ES5 TaxID=591445 RepID=A0AC34FZ10_9BILA